MEKLHAYINSLEPQAQVDFADRAGTTIGYLRKAISINQRLGEGICIRLVKAADGALSPEDLRDDVDWNVIRGTKAA